MAENSLSPSGEPDPISPEAIPNPQPAPQPPADSTATPTKRRRLWPKVVVGIFVALLLIVLLLPSIVSTGMVRRYVVGKINESLNGRVEIADWSIGWTSGIDVHGVRLFDSQKRTVAEIAHVRTALTLLNAVRGKYDFGDTVVDDPNLVQLIRHTDGTTNLTDLVKDSPKKEKSPSKSKSGQPWVKMNLHINRPRGMMVDEELKQQFVLDPTSDVAVKINGLDQPIENAITLVCGVVGQEGRGTLQVTGTASISHGQTNEVVKVVSFPLESATPFLNQGAQRAALAGNATGMLTVEQGSSGEVSVDGELEVANFTFGGEALQGETYRTSKLRLPIKLSRTAGDAQTAVLKVQTLSVQTDQFSANLTIDTTQEALTNLVANRPPGRAGHVGVNATINDVSALTRQLPKTLHLVPGVEVAGGRIDQAADIWLYADRAVIKGETDIRNVAGVQEGKSIALRPITQTFDATIRPTGTTGRVPDIHDFALSFDSGFGSIKGDGKTLAQINLNGSLNLPEVRKELGQFIDFGKGKLEGTVEFAARSQGDPTNVSIPIKSTATVTFHDVKLSGVVGEGDLLLATAGFSAEGNILRDADGALTAVDAIAARFKTGDSPKPAIDASLQGRLDWVRVNNKPGEEPGSKTAVEFHKFETKIAVDLPTAQHDLGPVLPLLKKNGIDLTSGQVTVTASGDFAGGTVILDASKPFSTKIENLTIRQGIGEAAHDVLKGETIALDMAGKVELMPTGTAIDLSALSVTSSSRFVDLHKSGDHDLIVRLTPASGVRGSGSLSITADLKKINDLASGFGSAKQIVANGPTIGDIRSGQIDGSIVLSDAGKDGTAAQANLVLSNFGLTTANKPIEGEKIIIALKATTTDDYSAVQASGLVTGSFFEAKLKSSQLRLPSKEAKSSPTAGIWDTIAQAQFEVKLPDLAKAYDYAERFQSPSTQPVVAAIAAPAGATAPASPASQPAPLPPIAFRSGSAVVRLDLSRDAASQKTLLQNGELVVSNLAFDRGDGHYPADPKQIVPQNIHFAAEIEAAANPENPHQTVAQQIRRITFTALDGTLAGGILKMPDRVTITGLGGALAASGSIELAGKLADITSLLEALTAKKPGTGYPYTGDYLLAQKITDTGDQLTLAGGLTINNFVVQSPGDPTPSFSEKQLVLTNNLLYDGAKHNLNLTNVAFDTKASDALHIAITGGITGIGAEQAFDQLQLSLGYDLEKIWPIIKPMLSPAEQEDFKEFVVQGKTSRVFTVRGSYPAGKPFNEAIKTVVMSGSLVVDHLEVYGMKTEKSFEIPIALENGIAYTLYADRPKGQKTPAPIAVNGGQMNLGGLALNLTGASPKLSTPKNHPLISNVAINPLLSDKLGQYVNFVLANPASASGMLDVTINYCQGLALGADMKTPDSGAAQVTYSIKDLNVVNPVGSLMVQQVTSAITSVKELSTVFPNLTQALSFNKGAADTFNGSITNAVFTVDRGQANVQTTIQLVETLPEPTTIPAGQPRVAAARVTKPRTMPFGFSGDLNLNNLEMSFKATLPTGLLSSIISRTAGKQADQFVNQLAEALPDGIPFSIRGTPKAPKFSIDPEDIKSIAFKFGAAKAGNLIGKQTGNPAIGNLINGAISGNKNDGDALGGIIGALTKPKKDANPPADNGNSNTPPASNNDPANILNNLLDSMGKKKEPTNVVAPPTPAPEDTPASPRRGRTGRAHPPATAPSATQPAALPPD